MGNNEHILFNVLAKDLENAKEISQIGGNRVLVGLLVKSFPDEEHAIREVKRYQENNIRVSIGLGSGDPTQWLKVANVCAATIPDHVNQVFPASSYTLGRLQEAGGENTIVNALIEPSGTPGKVYIATGPQSSRFRETVTCELAATMLAEIGVHSIKFYSIEGDKRLDEVAHMVKAATKAGIEIFEPTGGITLDNVGKIVETCLNNGAKTVIPHLYTSIIDESTGKTKLKDVDTLISLKW